MKITSVLFGMLVCCFRVDSQTIAPPVEFISPTMHENYCSTSPFLDSWQFVGPTDNHHDEAPYQGIITCVALDVNNPNTIYAGGNTQGLFKTIDGGITWNNITDQLSVPGLGINRIVIHPHYSNIVYAATGQRSNKYGCYSLGVIKTINGGSTWEVMDNLDFPINYDNNFYDYVLRTISLHPQFPDKVFVGGRNTIYRSNNAGSVWESIALQAENDFYVIDFEFSNADPQIIYASTISTSSDEVNIWVSLDGGQTWVLRSPLINANHIMRLDTTPADPGFLYCAYVNDDGSVNVMKSNDHGLSWVMVAEGLSDSAFDFYKGEFEVSNLTPNLIYYGDYRFHTASFDGTEWSSEEHNTGMHPDIRDVKLYSFGAGSEYILVGSDGGVQFSTVVVEDLVEGNSNIIWGELNGEGLSITQVYGLGVWNRSSNAIFGGQDIGTWRINNGLYSHEDTGDGGYSSVNEYFNTFGVGGSQSGKSYSNNSGESFTSVGSTYDSPEGTSPKTLTLEHYFSGKDQREFYVAGDDLAKWTINENTLTLSATPEVIPFQIPGVNNSPLAATAFCIAPSDGLTMYIAFAGTYWVQDVLDIEDPNLVNSEGDLINRLFKSTDGGENWIDITNSFFYTNSGGQSVYPYQWFSVSCIEVDPRNPQHVYVGISSYTSVPDQTRVIETYDGGILWEDMSEGIGSYPIRQLKYQDGSDEVIYAATDAGVFRWDAALDEWSCFNKDLPPCIVTTMNIDYCENSMTIGTYGRGIWKINLPPITNDVVFTSDYTIEEFEVHSYPNDIIVDAGATLTIKGHMFFRSGKGVVVKPGARLIVDGGLLSNACRGQLWQGIVLEGTPGLSQSPESNQGYCEIKNNATIENAHTGVHVAGLLPDGTGNCITDETKTGGILKATDATFLNCYVGVEFFPYVSFTTNGNPRTQRSSFHRCHFITDRVLDDSPIVSEPEPKAGIILNEIYRIRVRGCDFRNDAIGNPVYSAYYNSQYKRGDGIQANSAVFIVQNGITNDGSSTAIPCEFENLEHGIKSLCGDYVKPFQCQYAVFTNNFCGIRTEGTYLGPVIRYNTFYVNPIDDNMDGEEVSGIDVDNTTKFTIEQNTFLGSNTANPQTTIGIALNNTALYCDGDSYPITQGHNLIYKNELDNLDIGIQAEGENALTDNQNPSENFGLEFRCNKFGQLDAPCLTDFNLLAGSTVQNIQGANDDGEEAANIFDDNVCDHPTEHFTIGINANSIDKYYHNPNSGSLTLEPNCHNLGVNVPFETPNNYQESSTCPSYTPTGPIQLYQKHTLSSAGFTDTHNLYKNKIDKGNFQLLATLVDDLNAESIDLRNELIQCSPYVSDAIWHKAINRTVPMNPWHLAQALLANSPLNHRVQQMVVQSGLSNYYKTLIMNGQNGGITTRDIYESDLMLLNRRVQESKRDFINYYMLEEEDDDVDRMGAIASMLDRSDRTDNLILAGLALWKGDFTEATNLLDDCPAIGGNTDHLCQVLSIVIEEKSNSDVCFTPAGLAALQAVATDESECGYAQARAWLAEYADEEYPQNIGSSSGIPRNLMIEEGIADVQLLSAQPNPSQGTVYLTYLLPAGIESCELEIIDSNGKLIEKRLATGKGIEAWNCTECPSGIYLIRMMAEGIELATTKVSIVK